MTPQLAAALRVCRYWKLTGHDRRASFSAYGMSEDRRIYASVVVRLRAGESIEAMLWRGLAEFTNRLKVGMPKPTPAAAASRARVKARQRLRDTPSPSKFSN